MMRLCCLSLSLQLEFAAGPMDDLRFIDLCGQPKLASVDFKAHASARSKPVRTQRARMRGGAGLTYFFRSMRMRALATLLGSPSHGLLRMRPSPQSVADPPPSSAIASSQPSSAAKAASSR
jgi:hypothetical protein